jgi:hypothetical protein
MTARITIDEALARLSGSRATAGLELLDGLLVFRQLPSAAVVAAVVGLATEFDHAAHGLAVEVRTTLSFPPYDLLRPEVLIRRPDLGRLASGPGMVVLAVLVSHDEDETAWRARRCAAAGVAEVWTLAPGAGHGVRLSAPRGGFFTSRELVLPGERLAPAVAPWLEVVLVPSPTAPPRRRSGLEPGPS